nr:M48 family metallopeptidase [uncultured Holophaga sp.]
MSDLPFLQGYPEHLLEQVRQLLIQGTLGERLRRIYGEARHGIQSDRTLNAYAQAIKQQFMENAPPLAGASFDPTISLTHQALGLQTQTTRVQGTRLKSTAHIRIAPLFRDAPEPFLRMVVVHELAHLKEKGHTKSFYQLCRHMEPDYAQLEFDLRLYLTELSTAGATPQPPLDR